jgi:hypothetical protein
MGNFFRQDDRMDLISIPWIKTCELGLGSNRDLQ